MKKKIENGSSTYVPLYRKKRRVLIVFLLSE